MAPFFIAGATGYTGQAVARCLRTLDRPTIAHVRPDSPSRDRHVAHFRSLGCSLDHTPWEAAAMATSLARHAPAAVFSLLGTTRARGRQARKAGGPAETYESVDRDLSLMLLRAAEAVQPQPVFVYLSSLGAENAGSNRYMRARQEVEAALGASELPWVIARPAFISGSDRAERRPGERFAATALDAVLAGLSAVGAGGLTQRYHSLNADQLGAALVALASDPGCFKRCFGVAELRARAHSVQTS